ncbi:MAG TPA: DUF4397 domain-containing protein [Anseongella sp.]
MKRKFFTNISIILLASFTLTSCLNDDGDANEMRPGFLSFVNAMPDTSSLDFYVSAYGAPVDPENDLLGQGPLSFRSAFPTSSYVNAQPYTYVLRVTYPEHDSLLTVGTIDLRQDQYSTVYIYSNADSVVKGTRMLDDLESPASGMAKVRFMNLGQGTPEIDLVENGETTPLFDSFEFEEVSDEYKEIPAGSFLVDVKDSGTGDVLASGALELEDSKVYTVWISGISGETDGKALNVETIEHIPVEPETPAQ